MVAHELGTPLAILAQRICEAYPKVALCGGHVLDDLVCRGIAAAELLGLTDDEDIYRFTILPLILDPVQRRSAMIHGLIVRAMGQIRWTPTRRLDFIYEHVVRRIPLPSSEVGLAPLYTPSAVSAHEPRPV
jgi:hypothetical protein